MWGALVSAFGWLLQYVLGAGAIKWAVLALLWYGGSVLVSLLLSLLPAWFDATSLSGLFAFMPPGAWYFWDYAQGDAGLSMLLSAAVTRFLIRRIPFIG